MRVRGAGPVVIGLVAVLMLAGCGDGDDEQTLSEQELVTQSNQICATAAQRIEQDATSRFGNSQDVGSATQLETFASDIVVPEYDKAVDQLEDLKVPEREEGDFKDFLSQTRKALDDDVKSNPVGSLSQVAAQDPFVEANRQAQRLGLTECASLSQKIRASADRSPGKR
ncbi:MAG: hypothetical protein M3450_20720 [Actinomycetota bacterium]|nr:hypothetical protein [Actinomycetota bacterium]